MKVRKNEMKLRKKQIKVPKIFFVPHWIIQDLHGGIDRFPPTSDFLHRDIDGLILYQPCSSGGGVHRLVIFF